MKEDEEVIEVEEVEEAEEAVVDEDEEQWKDIEGYKNYKISSRGRIKNIITNKVHKFTVKRGYHYAKLKNDDGFKSLSVHRLVAAAFLTNDDPTKKRVVITLVVQKQIII